MAKTPQDGHCWPSWEGDPYNLGDKQLGQQFRAFLPKTAKTAKAFPPGGSPARRHTKPRRVCGRAILQHFYIFRGDRVHSCFCTPRSQALPGNALCQRLRLARQSLEGSGFPGRAWEPASARTGMHLLLPLTLVMRSLPQFICHRLACRTRGRLLGSWHADCKLVL